MKEQFLLDPEVIFLNHGSFGATPRPVFEVYQAWQRELERQPVQFLAERLGDELAQARQAVAQYINASMEDVVYVPNATYGVNVVAHSLAFGSGDEVLMTTHGYGACWRTWQYWAQQRGFVVRTADYGWLLPPPDEWVDRFMADITPRTKLIFLSHITSATAVQLPVAEICARARELGILTLVDGAHVPGQMPLDVTAVGADFYTGNCHKWLCAPKGSAFLYCRPEHQHRIEPLVVSWGWGENRPFTFGSDYADYLQWVGTNDPAAYLSVPEAIAYQRAHNWSAVRERCHALLVDGLRRVGEVTGLPSPYAGVCQAYLPRQMGLIPLPTEKVGDTAVFKRALYEQFRIKIPIIEWEGHCFTRLSVQAYTEPADVTALVTALTQLLA